MTDLKQVGSMKRSRALPRRVREVRVGRSRINHFRHTREAALRVRVSEIVENMLERITSGRSWMEVVLILPLPAVMLEENTILEKEDENETSCGSWWFEVCFCIELRGERGGVKDG